MLRVMGREESGMMSDSSLSNLVDGVLFFKPGSTEEALLWRNAYEFSLGYSEFGVPWDIYGRR